MRQCFEVKDSGAMDFYLGICIDWDRSQRKLWLSQMGYVLDLLIMYHLLDATPLSLPIAGQIEDLPDPPPNALPEIAENNIKFHYQCLVSLILYFSLCTQPDLAFMAMSLGQYNSNPSRKHLLAAKRVLQYLSGTWNYAIKYNFL